MLDKGHSAHTVACLHGVKTASSVPDKGARVLREQCAGQQPRQDGRHSAVSAQRGARELRSDPRLNSNV